MASTPAALLRRPGEPLRASFLELFFDLAFVLAIGQVSEVLLADLSVAGAARAALLLLPLWWVWVVTAWFSDWFARASGWVQALLVGTTLGVVLMSVAVPEATGGRAVLFAGAYVAIQVGRGVVTALALRGHPLRRRTLRVLVWFGTTGILWLVGAAWPAVRVPAWLLALAVDYGGPRLGWPTPGLGRAAPGDMRLRGGHLMERYQQIVIIALGELLITTGLVYSDTDMAAAQSAAFLLFFAAAVLIGLLYVTPAGRYLGAALDERDPSRFGVAANDLHLVMIAGVVATSVAANLVIEHPTDRGSGMAVALTVAGPALFLTGRVALSAGIYRRLSWPRLLGLLGILGTAAGGGYALPLLGVSATTVAVLLVVAVLERRIARTESVPPTTRAGR
ncbi:low temperature requirement protein LtrA [Micromonospora kangleipakensis]|uniref:Low temperature requirement protein LtrA n=1 Tax=Micromonospora kangleipakensis TaxID=1077942 RepID=A0A4Q8BC32_9ACTN|nr:low temperature requirement protein A [Micromonospora kangleipakensis]RZU75390.1 low temperature requirement protein LtrA [Micromonospora kangleipakensis]